MTEGNRLIFDPTGWTAEKLEWLVSYYLFADDDVSTTSHWLLLVSNMVSVLLGM